MRYQLNKQQHNAEQITNHNSYLYAMTYNFPRPSLKTWLLIADEDIILETSIRGSMMNLDIYFSGRAPVGIPSLFECKMQTQSCLG